jgi:hypothetical protein
MSTWIERIGALTCKLAAAESDYKKCAQGELWDESALRDCAYNWGALYGEAADLLDALLEPENAEALSSEMPILES